MDKSKVTELLLEQGITETHKDYSQIFSQLSEFEAQIPNTIEDEKKQKMLISYLNALQEGQNAEELEKIAKDLLNIKIAGETTALQEEVEQEKSSGGSFFNLIKNNQTTYNTIASFVAPNEQEQEQEKDQKIKERSDKIEHIRGDFALGTLSPEIKNALQNSPQLQNIKTGLSLYFTDRFNNISASDLTQVGNMGGFSGFISKASELMGMFGKFKSFNNQMTAINTVVEGMDIHSTALLTVDKTTPLHTLPAFQSAEGFYKLLVKHTPTTDQIDNTTENNTSPLGFDEIFALDEQGEGNSATAIITRLGTTYNNTTHNLLGSVLAQGPQILEKRTALQSTFGVVYDQLNQVAQLFGEANIADALKGTALGRVADFVCVLLGFGSLKKIAHNKSLKQYNEQCPARQKEGIEDALHYAKQFSKESYYTDQTNNPLHKAFDSLEDKKYTDAKTTKDAVLAAIPHDKLIKDGIVSALDKNLFFVHPQVLVGANITKFKISDYYDGDGKKKPYRLKKAKTATYKKLIADNIDSICKSAWTPLINPPDTIIQLVASGKTHDDIAQLLVTSLSLPEYAPTIVQDKLMNIGASSTTLVLAGYGKAQAEALETQQIQESATKSKEDIQKDLDFAEAKLTTVNAKINEKKAEIDKKKDQTNIETIRAEAASLAEEKTKLEEEIVGLKLQLKNFEDSTTTPPATAVIIPTGKTEVVKAKTGDYEKIENIDTKSTNEKALETIKYLVQHHKFTPQAAVGIVGNIVQESNFSVNIDGDNGTSYGICQRHNDRKTAVKNATKSTTVGQHLYAQLDFMVEGESGFTEVLNKIKTMTDISTAAKTFCTEYEKPSNASHKAIKRATIATQFYDTHKSQIDALTPPAA